MDNTNNANNTNTITLDERTRKILEAQKGAVIQNTLIGKKDPAGKIKQINELNMWYSAIDGTIYGFGAGNPNAFAGLDGETVDVKVKADYMGPFPETTDGTTLDILDIDDAVEKGFNSKYSPNVALKNALYQIKLFREGLKGVSRKGK